MPVFCERVVLKEADPEKNISPFFCHESGRRKQLQGDSYSRCWQSTTFSFSLVFWTVKGNEWFTFKCNTEFWGRYSPYLPTFCPSRLEQHNFTLTAHQSSNSLCLEILSPPTFFILVFGSLVMVAVQGSSALADLPTSVTEKSLSDPWVST